MKHKTFKIIKVPVEIDEDGYSLCLSKGDSIPCIYWNSNCEESGYSQKCAKEKIIYLKVETND